MRHRFVLLCLIVFLIPVFPASAAGDEWSVWLYTQASGRLRQIDDGGTLDSELTLPLPPDADASGYPDTVAVSHGGTLIAYALRTNSDNAPILLVWDTELAAFIGSYAMPPNAFTSLAFVANPLIFSENDTQIAFSFYVESTGVWQLIVLDLITSDVFTLSSSDPASVSNGLNATYLMPVVRMYRGAQVHFTMLPVPSDAFSGPSYVWDTISGTITPSVAYSTFSADSLLMTGETIAADQDDRFGFSTVLDAFPMVQFNTLQVYDPDIGGVFPIYSDTEASFFMPRFIQNGERVAAYGQRSDGNPTTVVLERNGVPLGSLGMSLTSIEGVFNGFVFTTDDVVLTGDVTSSALYYTRTRDGLPATAGSFIWNSPPGEKPAIVWTSDNFALGPTTPLPWAMLAPAIAVTGTFPALGAPPLPSPTPGGVFAPPTVAPAPGGLAPGVDAYISTTEGDRLRMRGGPGLSFAIIQELPDSTRVTILEGPRSADGFVWWRIRLANSSSGWVVEAADGIRTLVPVFGS